jgi:hypothetical protein
LQRTIPLVDHAARAIAIAHGGEIRKGVQRFSE